MIESPRKQNFVEIAYFNIIILYKHIAILGEYLVIVDLHSSLAYFMMTHPPPVAG